MAERSAPNGETLHFFLSDLVEETAAATFAEHERRIRERLPHVEVRHTGGTSVRGVLTMGDVDLQVRTDQESFGAARDALGELYEPHHPEVWHSEGAFFVALGSNPRVELALTRYNAMKRAHEGGAVGDYNAAKRAFFYDNFRL